MRVVVIGTGPAGITAAETLRSHDRDATIVALTTEPFAPYSPAAMADHFLTGRTDTLYWKGADVAERLGIVERRESTVSGIDSDNKEVVLADGERLPYDGLVLASGSKLHAPIDGAELPGVLDFKSFRTASALVDRVRRGEVRTALIVGNGFIGVELALLLSDLGVEVTVVGRRRWIMPRVLDPETSTVAEAALEARGVTLALGVAATAFEGATSVTGVRRADSSLLTADLYVAATGVKPHIEFLAGSDIVTDWGVHVDDRLRCSADHVVAAGDVAEAADWLTGERYVHAIFPNAVAQGRVAAESLVGLPVHYDGAESMNSLKHLGVPIVAMGSTADPDDVLRRRTPETVRTIYLRNGRIIGAQLAGDIRGAGLYHSLMLRRADVAGYGDRLCDTRFSMGDVAWTAMAPGSLAGQRP